MIALNIDYPLIIGKITKLEGKCWLRREYQSHYLPIHIGHEVCQGDLIKPDSNATVIIKFKHSNTLWRVPSGIESGVMNGYPLPPLIIEYSSEQFFSPR
ncbi:MAG: hypothetical protein AB4058_08805 [Microcystaceae cyanobacterium]